MLQYRPAVASDMHAIVRLHVEISQDAYKSILPQDYLQTVLPAEKQSLWQARLSENSADHATFVACDRLEVVGFCSFVFNDGSGFGTYLHNLYVSPAFQGQGAARALLCETIAAFDTPQKHQPVHLRVYAANAKASALYERLGGTVVERSEIAQAGHPAVAVLRYQWASANELAAKAGAGRTGS